MKQLKALSLMLVCAALITGFSACNGSSGKSAKKEYDFVICSGGGYNIVAKSVKGDNGSYDMVGVIDDDGKWIHELSKENFLIENERIKQTQDSVMVAADGGLGDRGTITPTMIEAHRQGDIQSSYHHVEGELFDCVEKVGESTYVDPINGSLQKLQETKTVFTYNAKENTGYYPED